MGSKGSKIMNNYVDILKGKLCWSVIAGSGTGSIVNFGFGEKKERSKPLRNLKLTDEERHFKPELQLMVYCAWRILKSDEVVCSWRDSNEAGGDMLKGLHMLRNKKVIDVWLAQVTYDLDVYFEGDMCVQLFCDQTNDYEADKNFILFMGNDNCTVGLKSILE